MILIGVHSCGVTFEFPFGLYISPCTDIHTYFSVLLGDKNSYFWEEISSHFLKKSLRMLSLCKSLAHVLVLFVYCQDKWPWERKFATSILADEYRCICFDLFRSDEFSWSSVKTLPLSVSQKLGNILLLCRHSCCFESAFISVSVLVPPTNLFLFLYL